jgi:AcrR family transcriptional regulator
MEVFAKNSFHDTSMNDVAEAAGVTKPVLYQHFASKRDLFLQLLGEIGEQLRESIAKATADASGPRQQIELGFNAYFTFVAENQSAFTVLFGSRTRQDEEFALEALNVEHSVAQVVADLIDIDTLSLERKLLLGNAIVGMAESACHYWLGNDVDVDPTTLAAEVSQLAWAGLRGVG